MIIQRKRIIKGNITLKWWFVSFICFSAPNEQQESHMLCVRWNEMYELVSTCVMLKIKIQIQKCFVIFFSIFNR